MQTVTVEQVLQLKASDELISVPASASVADAVEVMAARHVGAVVIKTEDGLVGGIFTERDLLKRVVHEGRDPKSTPISLVMTRDVRFVTPGDDRVRSGAEPDPREPAPAPAGDRRAARLRTDFHRRPGSPTDRTRRGAVRGRGARSGHRQLEAFLSQGVMQWML